MAAAIPIMVRAEYPRSKQRAYSTVQAARVQNRTYGDA